MRVTMITLLPILLFVSPVVGHSRVPRLKVDLSDEIKDRAVFNHTGKFATTLREGSTVYIGGNGVLHRINFDVSPTLETISVPHESKGCQENNGGSCGNYIMILQKFNETNLFVCGTNWMDPKCWLFFNNKWEVFKNGHNYALGSGVCPKTPQQGFTSLVVEQRLYSTASDGDRNQLISYKKGEQPSRLKSADDWMNDPKFVGMSPMGDMIYMFFKERIAKENPDIDPWISRIGRVCKNDRGGSRQRLLSKWATFLKARLLCSNPAENVHFNRIEDVFVYKSPRDNEERVYGIFSSNWNGTAVCVYSMKEISDVFEKSAFVGYGDSIPSNPRPGQCVNNTKELPGKVLVVMENHPEMAVSINPIGKNPLMISYQNHFKKIVVDSVIGPEGIESRVLYVAMGNGKIQKILEIDPPTFIVAELSVLKESAPILSMSLDSTEKLLYVTSAREQVRFSLVRCELYYGSCGECVQARDPYCGWDTKEQKCVPYTHNPKTVIQNLKKGDGCVQGSVARLSSSRQKIPQDWPVLPLSLDKGISVYLPCPKKSYHANYWWRFNDSKELPCTSNGDDCLLLLREVSEADIGYYECFSNERGMKRCHAAYVVEDNGSTSIHLSSVMFSVLMVVHFQFL
ncbi:semaphorin-7A-like [Hypanus sabinus]|uniref:semaphorin-7A-like n=1 Tax=Hypanus sabinus TaxID=79690 RepID=UPI0028C486FB|nr:semaphorin-7A-like [Hypanus sabinus]